MVEGASYRELPAQGLDKHPMGRAQTDRKGREVVGGGGEDRLHVSDALATRSSSGTSDAKYPPPLALKL